MKKNSALALLLFLALGGALLAKENAIIKVKVQMANVRAEPDASATIIARVPAGTLLEVTSQAGNWFEVNVSDQSGREVTGFIRDTVVEVVGGDDEENEEARPAYQRNDSAGGAGSAVRFGLNFGVQTDDTFSFDPFYWTVGAGLDFQFGSLLMFSPEVMLVGSGFEFKEFILYPAAMLNITVSSLFFGGGVAKGFYIGNTYGMSNSTDFLLKLNAGLVTRSVKLTAYALMAFDSLFKDMVVGATLGFRF
ncbi:MAG: SH3 domain-containing protein [Candidatus Aminicenantes bacterium]|nr:SH3 domain-containing protein [Candidatus Aminicenantes bacterium]